MSDGQTKDRILPAFAVEFARLNRVFTCILEFRGGTYISQYLGASPQEALHHWSANERRRLVWDRDTGLTLSVFDEIEAQELTPLKNLSNVWCATVTVGPDFVLFNVIATEAGEPR